MTSPCWGYHILSFFLYLFLFNFFCTKENKKASRCGLNWLWNLKIKNKNNLTVTWWQLLSHKLFLSSFFFFSLFAVNIWVQLGPIHALLKEFKLPSIVDGSHPASVHKFGIWSSGWVVECEAVFVFLRHIIFNSIKLFIFIIFYFY